MIWKACDGINQIRPIAGTLHRMVESQEQVATMGYVDDLDEQLLLEEMLEGVKPPYPEPSEGYHYLLTTPFRYPPLDYGSRFGRVHEPSLFYGGCSPTAILAESAYYRFVFLYSMEGVTDDDKIRSEHSMFSVRYKTRRGIQLQFSPFDPYLQELTHPESYAHAQELGSAMREADVDAFEYVSARDPNRGCCVGLFNKSPFQGKKPKDKLEWLCETTPHRVTFKRVDAATIVHFPVATFQLDGRLPLPA